MWLNDCQFLLNIIDTDFQKSVAYQKFKCLKVIIIYRLDLK